GIPMSAIGNPFSFKGEIGRLPYAIAATAAFFSQHAAASLLFDFSKRPVILVPDPWAFLISPLRPSVTAFYAVPDNAYLVLFALPMNLAVIWSLTALSFRRAANADLNPWIAIATVVPVIQLGALPVLSLIPEARDKNAISSWDERYSRLEWRDAILGLI